MLFMHRDFFYFMMSEHDIFVVKAGLFSCQSVAFFTIKKNSQKQKVTDFLIESYLISMKKLRNFS